MIRAGLSDDSRRMIRAKMGMIRALMVMTDDSHKRDFFIMYLLNYLLIIQLYSYCNVYTFFYFLTTFCNVHRCLDHLSVFDTVCK